MTASTGPIRVLVSTGESGELPTLLTLGHAGAVSVTSSAYGNAQSFAFWTPQPITITEILWRGIRYAATYQFSVDAVDIAPPRVLAATDDSEKVVFTGALDLPAGVYTFKLTKTGGANGWAFNNFSFVDEPWYFAGTWIEQGSNAGMAVRITALAQTNAVKHLIVPRVNDASRPQIAWRQTFHLNTVVLGLAVGNVSGQYGCYVNGVLVGTSPTQYASGSISHWIPFTAPVSFAAGATKEVMVKRTTGASASYSFLSTATSYSDPDMTIEHTSAYPSQAVIWSQRWIVKNGSW